MTLNEIMDSIETTSFYTEDVPTILQMLDCLTPEEFTKCLEEILEGNLFFSDFKDLFVNTDYSKNLEKTFEQQYKLDQTIAAIKAMREDILGYQNENSEELQEIQYFKKFDPDNPVKTVTGITRDVASKNDKIKTLYDHEEERLRKELLFTLTNINPTDNILTKQYKARLYKELNSPNSKYSVSDIFFFIQSFILPVDPQSQILTDTDLMFIRENGISEDEMRRIKAITIFLQQQDAE